MAFVSDDQAWIADISGRAPERVGTFRFDEVLAGVSLHRILLHKDRLLLMYVGGLADLPFDPTAPDIDPFRGGSNREDLRINTVVVDIGLEGVEPRVLRKLRLRGSYVDAEITQDGRLSLVTGYEQRRLPGETHPGDGGFSELESLEHNRELAAAMPLKSWMPEYRLTDGDGTLIASGMLGDCPRAYRLGDFAGPGVLSIATLDLADSGLGPPSEVVSVVASSASVNTSSSGLYVTTSPFYYELGATEVRRVQTDDPQVDVHWFEFSEQGVPQYASSVGITGWTGAGRVVDGSLRLLYYWYEHPDERFLEQYGLIVFDVTDADLKPKQQAEALGGKSLLTSISHTSEAIVLLGFPREEPTHAYVVELSDPSGEVSVHESAEIADLWAGFVEIGGDMLLHVGDDVYSADRDDHKRTILLLDVSEPSEPRLVDEFSQGLKIGPMADWSLHPTTQGAVAILPLEQCESGYCTVAVITAAPDGLTQIGTIAHRDVVVSSELVDNILYTITASDMIATDLTTMEQIARLPWWSE